MRRLIFVSLSVIMAAFLSGCEKEDPIPEERDPIFKDFEKRRDDNKKSFEENSAKIKEAVQKLNEVEPNSLEKKEAERDLANLRRQALNNQQMATYYKIRAERRKLEDRIAYKNAFRAKKEWPDPREYSDYLKNIQLQGIQRNWNARVPKLQSRLVSSVKSGEKKAEEPKKGEH